MENKELKNIYQKLANYKILFTYKDDKTSKNYVVYTDNTRRNDGTLNTYAAIYNPDNLQEPLKKIESQKEMEILDGILNSIQNNRY